jgi:hypothetical protein
MKVFKSALSAIFVFALLILSVRANAQDTIVGSLTYANQSEAPMQGIQIDLRNSQGVTVDFTTTDANGNYIIYVDTALPTGYYTVVPNCNLQWQPVTGTQIFRIFMHAIFGNVLEGIEIEAADVNDNQNVQIGDAVRVLLRVHGHINSFQAGDWQYETQQPILLNSSASKEETGGDTHDNDVRAKQSGDTDPAVDQGDTRKPTFVEITSNNDIYTNTSKDLLIPVTATEDMEIGAVSIKLKYPVELVEDIEISRAKANVNSSIDKENGTITITWSAVEEAIPDITSPAALKQAADLYFSNNYLVSLDADEVFCYIRVNLSEEFANADNLTFTPVSSGTDVRFDFKSDAKTVKFNIPAVQNIDKLVDIAQNYPNPCVNETAINYTVAEAGDVDILVYNAAGVLVESFNEADIAAGNHTFNLNTSNYQNGVYYYTFTFTNESNAYTKSFKLVVKK